MSNDICGFHLLLLYDRSILNLVVYFKKKGGASKCVILGNL